MASLGKNVLIKLQLLNFAIVEICLILLVSAYPRLQRPKLYGDAIPLRDLETGHFKTRRKIVLLHNFYRTRVDPPASNMLAMSWNDEAAQDAQRWAESCKLLVHDSPTGRWAQNYGSCGQNIFVANMKVGWSFAIKSWNVERYDFVYGSDKNVPFVVGHYTQMVWYKSHKVGCGFHYCGSDRVKKPFYNYVCNYCPIGNDPATFNEPYEIGKPCSKCPGKCKYKKLCTNACKYGDSWSNCAELNATWNNWLCSDPNQQRYHSCLGTCRCGSGFIR